VICRWRIAINGIAGELTICILFFATEVRPRRLIVGVMKFLVPIAYGDPVHTGSPFSPLLPWFPRCLMGRS
jgi:hypothetical protein